MKETFWPSFSNFFIPHTSGMPHWWDIFWWCFQIIVMAALLLGLRKMALRADEDNPARAERRVETPTKPSFPG
jgi:hypothetical protein